MEDFYIMIAVVVVVIAILLVRAGMGMSGKTLRTDIPRMLPYRGMVLGSAALNKVDPCLLAGVIERESAWNPSAVNPTDPSYGIAQIKVSTAGDVRPGTTQADLMDPEIGIEVAARYIRSLEVRYGIPLPFGIDAYNVGPGNWQKGNRSTVYRDAVLKFSKEMCR